MYKIGLTGGIASGKTTLSKYLASFKYIRSLNMDLAAHKLYKEDYFLRKEVASRFGSNVLTIDETGAETINRKELGRIVFSSREDLKRLNELIHPRLYKYMDMEFEAERSLPKEIRSDVVFVEGAVIIESGGANYFDEIWVTTLSKEEALKRVFNRNPNLTKEQAEKRVMMQTCDEKRLKYAKFWYDTARPFEENKKLIDKELERLKQQGKLRKIEQI